MIGSDELAKEREDRIEKLKKEHDEMKQKLTDLEVEHGSLQINHTKVVGQYEQALKDLNSTADNLHTTNKVRHDTEIKFCEEIERVKNLQEVIKMKDETLNKRAEEIEILDRKVLDLERANETIEVKKQGIERQAELIKKQLNEKIASLNEIVAGEKETREMWIERFETEQKAHTETSNQLMQSKSDYKDQLLATKNAEIKMSTFERQCEILNKQNSELQQSINEVQAKLENTERDLNTQQEILRVHEKSKQEIIDKLKRDLESVDDKYTKIQN